MSPAREMLRVPAARRCARSWPSSWGEAVGSVEIGVHGELAVYGPSAGLRALACALFRAADKADELVSGGREPVGRAAA
jgi:hypothetical protein